METTDLLLEQCRTGSSPCGPADVWAHSVTGMKIQPITACVSEARETQMLWISGQNQLSSPSNKSFLHSALADYQIQIEIRLQMTSSKHSLRRIRGVKQGPNKAPSPWHSAAFSVIKSTVFIVGLHSAFLSISPYMPLSLLLLLKGFRNFWCKVYFLQYELFLENCLGTNSNKFRSACVPHLSEWEKISSIETGIFRTPESSSSKIQHIKAASGCVQPATADQNVGPAQQAPWEQNGSCLLLVLKPTPSRKQRLGGKELNQSPVRAAGLAVAVEESAGGWPSAISPSQRLMKRAFREFSARYASLQTSVYQWSFYHLGLQIASNFT